MELPKRSTRGKRMEELVGEAKEADAEFWNQEAWQELSEDDDIGSGEFESEEMEDIEDSDFDEIDEEAVEREAEEVAERMEKQRGREERAKRRKAHVYMDPALQKERRRRSIQGIPREQKIVPMSTRELRASTTSNTIKTADKLSKRATRKGPVRIVANERKLTQEELLAEAARTELENKRSLAAMLMLKEERKKRNMAAAKITSGPRLIFRSSKHGNSITFTDVDTISPAFAMKPEAPKEHPVCSITGLKAKYRSEIRDPKTGLPYATLEAFKVIRNKHSTRLTT